MSTHQPLKITFKLVSPMVDESYPIHLDSLIAWCKVKESKKSLEQFSDDDQFYEKCLEDLPLQKDESGVWQASKLFFKLRGNRIGANTRRFIVRKTETRQIALNREWKDDGIPSNFNAQPKFSGDALNENSGGLRNFQHYYNVKDNAEAVCFCVGDRNEIENLLNNNLVGIGKYVPKGHGKIASIIIEPDESAIDNWKYRAMPYEINGYFASQITIKPPYFDKKNQVIAWLPTVDDTVFFN